MQTLKRASAMLLYIFALSTLVSLVQGHGRLTSPPGRATAWRYGFKTPVNYQDNELWCGGRAYQHEMMDGQCGICGDPYDEVPRRHEAGGLYATGTITESYQPGQVITVTVQLTMNHRGYFEFRLCPVNDYKTAATEECLERHVLRQPSGKVRMELDTWDSGEYNIDLQLPRDLTCTQCVLQWKYVTGNSWGCWKNSVTSRWLFTPRAVCCTGCGNQQEEFYGCADISIGKGSKVTSRRPIPSTTVRTTSRRTTPEMTTPLRTTTPKWPTRRTTWKTSRTTRPTRTTRRTTRRTPKTTRPTITTRRTTRRTPRTTRRRTPRTTPRTTRRTRRTTRRTRRTTPSRTTAKPANIINGNQLCAFFCSGHSTHFCPRRCWKGYN